MLSEGLSARRGSKYDTTLIGGALEPGEISMDDFARTKGVQIHKVHSMRRAISPVDDVRAFLELVARIQEIKPTIVHTHTAKAGTIGRLAARASGVPIVVHTFHGHVLDGYFSKRTSKIFQKIERFLAHTSDVIVTLSKQQKKEIVETYKIAPERKVRVIPLGVDLSSFEKLFKINDENSSESLSFGLHQLLNLPKTDKVFFSAGRFVSIKRFDLMLRAFEKIASRYPHIHLAIAGEGDKKVHEQLQNLVSKMMPDTQRRIHFLGMVNNVPELACSAHRFVLSSDNEGTPVAVLESLFVGTKVIATRVGGIEDILFQEQLGVSVPRNDCDALVQAMEYSLFESQQRVPLEVRKQLRDKYSQRRLIQNMESLYDELIERRLFFKRRGQSESESKDGILREEAFI